MSSEPTNDPDLAAAKNPVLPRVAAIIGAAALIVGLILYLRPGSEPETQPAAQPSEPPKEVAQPAPVEQPPPAETAVAAEVPKVEEAPKKEVRASREDVINAIKLAGQDDPALARTRKLERDEKAEKKAEAARAKKKKIDDARDAKKKRDAERRDRIQRDQIIEEVASEWEERPTGGLSEREFHDTLVKWAGVKQCLQTHVKRAVDANGMLRVQFRIKNSGQVQESLVYAKSNDTAKEIAPCVQQESMQIHFPSFTGEGTIIRRATFLF